jgi:MoaA/NifB/PqqE/SkfB family radical SAM enzyme
MSASNTVPVALGERLARHVRLSLRAHEVTRGTPQFLILFINSICNLKCAHCFYWQHLNQPDDLTLDEIVALSDDLDPFDHLYLSGGEPFLRKEFAEVCLQFIARNRVRHIYVPTNGFYLDRTVAALRRILENPDLRLFACELSLDGMPAFHNRFRGDERSFEKAMGTYDALAELQREDPRLRIHAISTVTDTNAEEIRRLTTYLYERCPRMDHHNLALLRGERKDPELREPELEGFTRLWEYARRLWSEREAGRFGSSVDPMLTWAKLRTAREQRMVVPCRAGNLSGVVYANGDVAICETTESHPPLGNLRHGTFREIWFSEAAEEQRRRVRCRACHCTNEVFLWPSIVYQPVQLGRALVGARPWRRPVDLPVSERVEVRMGPDRLPVE